MPDCVTCQLFSHETEVDTCLHVNRPGGLKLTELALNMAQLPEGANILDVASGTSATLHYMINQRGYNAVGLDLSSGMLRLSKDVNPELHLIEADCGAIPLVDRSRHAVLMECALDRKSTRLNSSHRT